MILAARDEQHLLSIAQSLDQAKLPYRAIQESEGPYGGQTTALGLFPGPKDVVGRPLGSLPLAAREHPATAQLRDLVDKLQDLPVEHAKLVTEHFRELTGEEK